MKDAPAPLHIATRLGQSILDKLGIDTMPSSRLCWLVYLCDGWHLALRDAHLCDDHAEASDVGPAYPRIVEEGVRREVAARLGYSCEDPAALTGDQHDIMDAVLRKYARLSSSDLHRAVCAPGSPWERLYMSEGGRMARMETDPMRTYFLALAELGRSARLEDADTDARIAYGAYCAARDEPANEAEFASSSGVWRAVASSVRQAA